jgi:putative IMPACT (imprinted ancient) family translation regulator
LEELNLEQAGYGDAAKRVLQVLTKQEFIAMEPLYLTMSFALESRVRKEVQAIGGNVKEVAYGQEVTMTVEKPKQKLLALPYSVESSLESPI